MMAETLALALMALMAGVVVWARDLVHAVLALSLFSTILSLQYLWLHAPDVAMTEAALGAGLSTVVFLVAIRRIGGRPHE